MPTRGVCRRAEIELHNRRRHLVDLKAALVSAVVVLPATSVHVSDTVYCRALCRVVFA